MIKMLVWCKLVFCLRICKSILSWMKAPIRGTSDNKPALDPIFSSNEGRVPFVQNWAVQWGVWHVLLLHEKGLIASITYPQFLVLPYYYYHPCLYISPLALWPYSINPACRWIGLLGKWLLSHKIQLKCSFLLYYTLQIALVRYKEEDISGGGGLVWMGCGRGSCWCCSLYPTVL